MDNFALVCKGVYRSGFPKKKNFAFMKKLGLKSVLTLILEEYPEQNLKFLNENGVKLFQFGVAGNKEPFVDIPEDVIAQALTVILGEKSRSWRGTFVPFFLADPDLLTAFDSISGATMDEDKRNHPILIHCNKGKHRTGCLIGCLRKLQGWSLTSSFAEYRRFSQPKERAMDQQFIEVFDTGKVEYVPEYVPEWPEVMR
ncbi:hypothetical protein HDU93_000332 [Gonapodya sp. JEL0774]|nr:hypothetical protein HDU93_000332 [Gonapodya sp. JEL0774]